jgi:hypothetical protein
MNPKGLSRPKAEKLYLLLGFFCHSPLFAAACCVQEVMRFNRLHQQVLPCHGEFYGNQNKEAAFVSN